MRDFYAVLGVPRSAAPHEIRQRFLSLARERHPDRFQGDEKLDAERTFQEITEAFNILSNPERRRLHDLDLSQGQSGGGHDPSHVARVYLQRGVKAYREKKFIEAADNFDRATNADPSNAKAWYNLALTCAREPRWMARAISASARACELEPMNPAYFKTAGRIFAAAGQTDKAEAYLRQAIRWGGEDLEITAALEALRGEGGKRKGRSALSFLLGKMDG